MRRLLVLIVGFLASWLGAALPAVGAADLPTHPELVQAYAYDADGASAPYDTAIDRGPPTSGYTDRAAHHAVDRWSRGTSASQSESTTSSTYAYDRPAKVAQVAPDAGMTWGPVEDVLGGSVAVDHGHVAANTATKLNRAGRAYPEVIDPRTGLSPPGVSGDLIRWEDAGHGTTVEVQPGVPRACGAAGAGAA